MAEPVSADGEELARQIDKAREDGWIDLEPDKRAFAYAYIDTYSHVDAARVIGRAGQGLRYMRDPFVLALIRDLQQVVFEDHLIVDAYVKQKWMEVMPKLLGDEDIPMVDRDGNTVHGKKFHSTETVAALKELSRQARYNESTENAVQALFRNAMAGNVEAQKFYLKNKNPQQWRDKVDLDVNSSKGALIIPGVMSPDDWQAEMDKYNGTAAIPHDPGGEKGDPDVLDAELVDDTNIINFDQEDDA
jgi:phage terminase small subunit